MYIYVNINLYLYARIYPIFNVHRQRLLMHPKKSFVFRTEIISSRGENYII